MLVIRLARTGKKHQAYFRIVVADSKRAVTSKFIEILGNYNPHQKSLTIDRERLSHHLSNGAQPSNTLAKLLVKEKIELPKWVKIAEKNKNPKKEPEVKEAKPEVKEPVSEKVENEATEAAEVPAEEAAPVSEETTEAPEEEAKEEASTESTVENAEESVNSQEKEDSASSEVEKAEKEVQEETK